MKFFALLALLGVASSVRLSGDDKVPRGPDGVQSKFGYYPPDDEAHGGPLHDDAYKREVPERFSGAGDDRLMNSIISKYAIDKKDPKTGQPTGHFYVDEKGAEAIAREVIQTHLKKTGSDLDDYANKTVAEAW